MFLATLILAVAPAPDRTPSLDEFLDVLQSVETGGEPDGGRAAIGDGGRSIGPLQIQRAYWIDSGVPGRFQDCRDARYARRVVEAYWKRWCPDALAELDLECLARVHNGGPRGMRRAATKAYWKKVEAELARRAVCSTRGDAAAVRPPAPARSAGARVSELANPVEPSATARAPLAAPGASRLEGHSVLLAAYLLLLLNPLGQALGFLTGSAVRRRGPSSGRRRDPRIA